MYVMSCVCSGGVYVTFDRNRMLPPYSGTLNTATSAMDGHSCYYLWDRFVLALGEDSIFSNHKSDLLKKGWEM